MAAPVWVLSVDLQTKSATFVSGMGEAARAARGAFTDIKNGAQETGGHVSSNMFASRHAIMAASEAFGETMPRAITALLVHIEPLGAAFEAAFPFAAIALGAVLLIEHLGKLREEGQKLTLDQERFGTTVQNVFNSIDQKMLQAEIRSDELRNDHLAALRLQLELIDKQSMAELVRQFGEIAKGADVVFAELKSHWYTFGIGATGAKSALDTFQAKYADLLAHHRGKEASDLLRGTRESAEKTLAAMTELRSKGVGGTGTDTDEHWAAQERHAQLLGVLKQAGLANTESELKAQQQLLGALRAQEDVERGMAALAKVDKGNATKTTGNESAAKAAEAARQAAEHQTKIGELRIASEREQANVSMSLRNATIAERLASDIALADKEYAVQEAGNKALIAALDRSGKDYNNQLKALQDKALEITAQHENAVAVLKGKASIEQYRLDLANMEESERAQINATRQGSAGRLAVIDAALRDEQGRRLTDTQHYRELLGQRSEVGRQAAEEDAKLRADAGREAAEQGQKMGELLLAAQREHVALMDSGRRVTAQMRLAEDIDFADKEYALKLTALSQQKAALDRGAKDYDNKLKEIQDKRKQLIQQHENEVTAIKDKAEIERNTRILSAERQFNDTITSGLTETLMGHKSFAAMMTGIGNEIVSGMTQNAVKSILANDMTKESDAAAAARKAFNAGMHFPWPTNLVMAPLLGAAAFTSVMAFAGGTDGVPGIGRGDVVPAMLTPGEGVVPGGVMDGLRKMVSGDGFGGGTHYHAHVQPVYHLQALDGAGMDRVLEKNGDRLQKHVESAFRKMGR